jgi:serine/threonine protein kinase
MAERIGTEIAGYRIESLLARGGMGEVYLAAQGFPEREVALKLLAHDLGSDLAFRERFIRESNAAASLEHRTSSRAMEPENPSASCGSPCATWTVKTSEASSKGRGRWRPSEGLDLCAGRRRARRGHEHGLVHCDVRPGNILVTTGDRAYLSDFGLIGPVELDTSLTKTGQLIPSVQPIMPTRDAL